MAASEATGSRFRARAGTLTLLVIASLEPRERMLEILEEALDGGVLPELRGDAEEEDALVDEGDLIDEGDLVEDGFEIEDDEELDEDELYGEEEDEDEFEIGPHTPLRATPKAPHFFEVTGLLERWLEQRPGGVPKGLDRGAAIATLVCGWSATVTHALAREPLTLAELDEVVTLLERETVEEHIEAMESIGLVEAETVDGETRYAPTEWLRRGLAPLAAAARLELHFPEEDIAPPDILDVEASFQLSLRLLQLPPWLRGSCRLGVELPDDPPLVAGATVQVDGGSVVASSPLLEESPDTWATGSPQDWLDTLLNPEASAIAPGGDVELAEALVLNLHEALFSDLPH